MKHPGQRLREDFMEPLHFNTNQLAKGLGISRSTLARLLSGKQRLSLKMAARLATYFGVPARWWLQMQSDFDAQQIEEHPEWHNGVTPAVLDPALLVTPKGILHLGEPIPMPAPPSINRESIENLPVAAPVRREVKHVRYENGSIALVGDAP
jgi:addiction module HigA family antidote